MTSLSGAILETLFVADIFRRPRDKSRHRVYTLADVQQVLATRYGLPWDEELSSNLVELCKRHHGPGLVLLDERNDPQTLEINAESTFIWAFSEGDKITPQLAEDGYLEDFNRMRRQGDIQDASDTEINTESPWHRLYVDAIFVRDVVRGRDWPECIAELEAAGIGEAVIHDTEVRSDGPEVS